MINAITSYASVRWHSRISVSCMSLCIKALVHFRPHFPPPPTITQLWTTHRSITCA
ncbi:hypothetical protein BJV74DRAFT_852292 [Russula compacta]|nr:hypothetical protein BJV74DRAFT_852292 [Russula compacta]